MTESSCPDYAPTNKQLLRRYYLQKRYINSRDFTYLLFAVWIAVQRVCLTMISDKCLRVAL